MTTESNPDTHTGPERPLGMAASAGATPIRGKLQDVLERIEREMIVEALRASHGNKAQAARALGLTERVMGLRVRKLGLNPRDFRTGPQEGP